MRIRSFEQVVASLGLASPRYFYPDMGAVSSAIENFRPDALVAGRHSALLAGKSKRLPVVAVLDKPQLPSFASSPERTRRLRASLSRRGLGDFESILDIAYRADLIVVPNLREFSDIGLANAVYVGPLGAASSSGNAARRGAAVARDSILCYDCLLEGNPQIAVPREHFERASNARATEAAGAGLVWDPALGDDALCESVRRAISDPAFAAREAALDAIASLVGAEKP